MTFYQSYVTFEIHERMGVSSEKEFSVRISLSEGAHGYPLDVSLDAKHALQVQPRRRVIFTASSIANEVYRVLTNHIALPEAINKLSRHTAYGEILKKSTTPYEGLLPVEGDVLYLGKEEEHVQLRHFVGPDKTAESSRANSRHSSYHGDPNRDSIMMSSNPPSATGSAVGSQNGGSQNGSQGEESAMDLGTPRV
jgi:hypothetical protein